MSASSPHFIIVDNSQLDCFIAEKMIQNTDSYSSISFFTDAKKAFQDISGMTNGLANQFSIILLDIQTIELKGFNFIESFEQLPLTTKANYAIFLLSSSVNDKSKFKNYSSVRGFFSKPLSKEKLSGVFELI